MPVEAREFLPFEIVKEPWNQYVIKDQGEEVILRGRLILAKVTRLGDTSNPKRRGIQVAPHQIWITHSPANLRGDPTPRLPSPVDIANDQKIPLEVETRREDWSAYHLPGDKVDLRLRFVISRVFKVRGLFAADREPYFLVESAGLTEFLKDGEPVGMPVGEPVQ
jgi:hypothetical protein